MTADPSRAQSNLCRVLYLLYAQAADVNTGSMKTTNRTPNILDLRRNDINSSSLRGYRQATVKPLKHELGRSSLANY